MNLRRWIALLIFSLITFSAAADGVGIDPHGRPKPLSADSGGAMDPNGKSRML
jgi:hypothetical protein